MLISNINEYSNLLLCNYGTTVIAFIILIPFKYYKMLM